VAPSPPVGPMVVLAAVALAACTAGSEPGDSGCGPGDLAITVTPTAQPQVLGLALALADGRPFTGVVDYRDANDAPRAIPLAPAAPEHALWLRLLPPDAAVDVAVRAILEDGHSCEGTVRVETGSLALDGVADSTVQVSDAAALAQLGSAFFLQVLRPADTWLVLRDLQGRLVWGAQVDVSLIAGNLARSAVVSRDGEHLWVLLESGTPADPGLALVLDWTGELVDTVAIEGGGHHQLGVGEEGELYGLGYAAGWHGVETTSTPTGDAAVYGDTLVRLAGDHGAEEVIWTAEEDLPTAFTSQVGLGLGHVSPSYANGLGCTPRCGVSLSGEFPGFALEDASGGFHAFYSPPGEPIGQFGSSPHDLVRIGDELVAVYDRRIEGCSGFELWRWGGGSGAPDSLGRFVQSEDAQCGVSIVNGGNALLDHGDGSDPSEFTQALFHTEWPHLVELVQVSCPSDDDGCDAALILRLATSDEGVPQDPGFGELYSAAWLSGG